jgi:hypothetical protein
MVLNRIMELRREILYLKLLQRGDFVSVLCFLQFSDLGKVVDAVIGRLS